MENSLTSQLKKQVKTAVNKFLVNDIFLLKNQAHEQAISHRIAVYLEELFPSYHVDCEYNKHKYEKKIIDEKHREDIASIIETCKNRNTCSSCKQRKKTIDKYVEKGNKSYEIEFRPDILVHLRNSNKSNHIAIELKKYKECYQDKEKVRILSLQEDIEYKYQLGAFIYFDNKTYEPDYTFYVNGKEINVPN